MGIRNSSGFTIIETMLFLAVTGLLIMGALIGTGASLSNQRYRDAVETFKGVIQAQYADLGSVRNDRTNAITCETDASLSVGPDQRGQSDCLIVGRYMVIDGEDIAIYTVLSREQASAPPQVTDVAALRNNYSYNIATGVEERSMEWGTQIAWPTSGPGSHADPTPSAVALLFIRSPESGRIYTFTSDTVPSGPAAITSQTFIDMISSNDTAPATGMGERTICVQSGGLIVGGDRSIYIAPRASSASAVEVRTNDTTGAVQC